MICLFKWDVYIEGMRITVGAGTYVVAVSGGVDSIVLLHLLMQQYKPTAHPSIGAGQDSPQPSVKKAKGSKLRAQDSNRRFVVAHFDHGIRPDSSKDRQLVKDIARKYGLPFVHEKGSLGPGTSEAKARKARYEFLRRVQKASGAHAIITAHHEDDVLETAIINLLRGSGRRGLPALQSHEHMVRPLLGYGKEHIRDYANMQALQWREDPTNEDMRYLRNYVRHKLLSKFSAGQRAQLSILLEQLTKINKELDVHIDNFLHIQPAIDMLNRQWFISLPHDIAKEATLTWLRRHGVQNLNRKNIEKIVVAMKTFQTGKRIDIDKTHTLYVKRYLLALHTLER